MLGTSPQQQIGRWRIGHGVCAWRALWSDPVAGRRLGPKGLIRAGVVWVGRLLAALRHFSRKMTAVLGSLGPLRLPWHPARLPCQLPVLANRGSRTAPHRTPLICSSAWLALGLASLEKRLTCPTFICTCRLQPSTFRLRPSAVQPRLPIVLCVRLG